MKQMGLILAVLVLALASLCGCETLNKGTASPHRTQVIIHAPVGTGPNGPWLFGNETGRFSATTTDPNGPFTFDWNFGGAATNTTSTLAQAGTSSVNVIFVSISSPNQFTATVTMTTGDGRQASDSVTFSLGPVHTSLPSIDSLTVSGGIVTVSATDPDGDSLTFQAFLDSGNIDIEGPFNETSTSAQWKLSPRDVLTGGNWTITVTADDGNGGTASDSLSGGFDAFPLANDTLYAIATSSSTSTGSTVRIAVATGDTANNFQYLNGCGVVCENGASYAATTFDVGSPDDTPDVGSANPIDGVWGDMGATSFLLAPDNFITGTDLGNGTSRTDFNVTPLGGTDITANGLLFSFEYTFASAGTYHLGFEAVNIVSRTYYQDSTAATDFFWSDISNNHAYNTIIVE
ncbi:MAG: hypothetical protein R3F46_09165 [bacterium]